MMISTGYTLPFAFLYSPAVLSAGLPAFMHVRFRTASAADEVSATVQAFASLASSGALCGAAIEPARSTIELRPLPPLSPNDLHWSFDEAYLCDEALVVLAHMLLAVHQVADIERVQVFTRTGAPASRLAHDSGAGSTFPPGFRQFPFQLHDEDPLGDDFSFEIELDAPLTPENRPRLNVMLAAWSEVVMRGGYADAPTPANSGYAEPDEEVVAYGHSVEWAVSKLRADGACIDAVLNGLAAFDARCQHILRVTIS